MIDNHKHNIDNHKHYKIIYNNTYKLNKDIYIVNINENMIMNIVNVKIQI